MTDKKELELQFAADCKVIELKYEYRGYTGKERYGLITALSERELCGKYECLLESYVPYIVLDLAFAEVRDDFRRNEQKFEKRSKRGHLFGIDDEFDIHHPECASPDCLEQIISDDSHRELLEALEALTERQRRRIVAYYFDQKSLQEIAQCEGTSTQSIHESISLALSKLKKVLKHT